MSFKKIAQNKRVIILSDNSVTFFYINKQGGTRSWKQCAIAWVLFAWYRNTLWNCQLTLNPAGRMVLEASGLSKTGFHLVSTGGGSLRHSVKQEVAQIHVTGTGPSSMGERCTVPGLEWEAVVRLPSVWAFTENSAQDDIRVCFILTGCQRHLGSISQWILRWISHVSSSRWMCWCRIIMGRFFRVQIRKW